MGQRWGHRRHSLFLSTPSARRATAVGADRCAPACISIHALREEGDVRHADHTGQQINFYPRPPRGGRLLFGRG